MTSRNTNGTEALTEHAGQNDGPFGCVVYVVEGETRDRRSFLALERGTALVGVDPGCDLHLHDSKMSREHLELAVTADGIRVRDLGSTNGTSYLGNRINEAVLKPGARLRLGRTVLAILPLGEDGGIEPDEATRYGHVIGASVSMRRVFSVLRRLEGSDVPVLILGETGSGKEMVARTLHEQGHRRDGPFVVVDCGAIPRELIDSELFGHVRGAFTGATTDRVGLFEQAHGGTLFLDEIGELPLDLQPRLLRVLDMRRVRRVGDNSYTDVDVRPIAATHQDLVAAVERHRFREDLYYRLAVVRISVPPLRERSEDIPLLAQHLAAQITGDREHPIPDEVLNVLSGHDWPGNVRELRNLVQQLLALGELVDTPGPSRSAPTSTIDPAVPYKEAREKLLHRFEAEYVRTVLHLCDGNISRAARMAGLARRYFRELLQKHGLYEER